MDNHRIDPNLTTTICDFISGPLDITLQKKASGHQSARKGGISLGAIAEAIVNKLDPEERKLAEIGMPLPSIHLEEHKKMRRGIAILEFRWKAKLIEDKDYIRALSYKLEFHDHYFNRFI